MSEPDWNALRRIWAGYRDAVEAWLETAPEGDTDPAALDALIHELIDGHNRWSDDLKGVLQATHRH